MTVPAATAAAGSDRFDYTQSEDRLTHEQIDANLVAFRAAHPGVEIKKRQRMWSVTFDADKQPTGSNISRDYAFPNPLPAEGSPEELAYVADMKKAAEFCGDLDDLTDGEKQYTIFGYFFDYCAGEECFTVTTTMGSGIFCSPSAKPLVDTDFQPLRDAAKLEVRKQNKARHTRLAAGEPEIMRVKDLRRDNPEIAAGLPADTPDDAMLAVKMKDWNKRHPRGWKPKGWTRKKEHAFQHWLAAGTPGMEQHGEPLPEEELREVFDDTMNAGERQDKFERELAELVQKSGGTA